MRVYLQDEIGIATIKDTLNYMGKDNPLRPLIHSVSHDSITLQRPLKYHDTIVMNGNGLPAPYRFVNGEWVGERRATYRRTYLVVDSFAYQSFALKDITSFEYVLLPHDNRDCQYCWVPPVTIYLIAYNRKRWHYRRMPIRDKQWKIVVEDSLPVAKK